MNNFNKQISLLWADGSHAADIAQIQGRLFPDQWSQDAIRRLLANDGATSLVARSGSPLATIGYILAQIAADEAEILSIGVTPDVQRRGVGRQLLRALLRAAWKAEVKSVHLEVAADNRVAEALYKSEGFLEVGRRPEYYARANGPAVDAVRLALKFGE
ncbi:MAG TPA: ribosomal protein S18-alanine N-acetyltransferase [Hyphomicrobiaceae bacterium]|nr:ribosomal protein S18-alanine N-acetyltransferase [Hyphomicrobiaceae bacterium]